MTDQERKDVIILERSYDDSDSQSDYFADRSVKEVVYAIIQHNKPRTEKILRECLKLLSKDLQSLPWRYEKAERYSMARHPYARLIAVDGVKVKDNNGNDKDTWLELRYGWESASNIPETLPNELLAWCHICQHGVPSSTQSQHMRDHINADNEELSKTPTAQLNRDLKELTDQEAKGESNMTNLSFNEARDEFALSLFGLQYAKLHEYNKTKVDRYMNDITFIERWLTVKHHKAIKVNEQ